MVRFKHFLFITEEKIEKFVNIKDVEGSPDGKLDPNNPVHQQMARLYGNIPKDRRKIVDHETGKEIHMKNAQDIKSFRHFHQLVNPEIETETTTNQHRDEDKEAFQAGEAKLVHHDPASGAKVYEVNSAAGSCAAAAADGKDDTKWCTTSREKDQNAFDHYAQGQNKKSFVIHLPKEKGNLQKIGIYGVRPWDASSIEEGLGGNFQDKGNNTVTDKDWNRIRHQYNIGNIKELEGIRGVGIEKKNVDDMMYSGKSNEIEQALRYHPDIKEHHVDSVLERNSNYEPRPHMRTSKEQARRHKFSADLRAAAIRSPSATKKHVDKVLGMNGNEPDEIHNVQESAIESPAATKEHIDHVLNNYRGHDYHNSKMRELAIQSPHATKEHIDRVLGMNGNEPDTTDIRMAAIKNPNYTKEHLDHILGMNGNTPELGAGVRRRAIEGPHVTKEHVDKVLGMNGNEPDPHYSVRLRALNSKRINKDHISHVLGMNDNEPDHALGVREAAIQSPHATKEHVDHVLGMNGNEPDRDLDMRIYALQSPHATKEHVDKVLGMNGKTPDIKWDARVNAMQSPHATKEHVDHVLGMNGNNPDKHDGVRRAAILSRHSTKEHLDRVLGMNGNKPDSDSDVRRAVFESPHATKDHVDHVLGFNGNKRDNWIVTGAAIRSPHATKEHFDRVLGMNGNKSDFERSSRESVLRNPLHTKEHIDKILGMNGNEPDSDVFVRRSALESPHATKEHFQKAVKDEDIHVKERALSKLYNLNKQKSKNVQEGVQMDTSKKIADVLNKIHQRAIKRTGIIPPVKTAPIKKQPRKSLQQRHLQLITSKP